jgi:hypothetical protein
MPSKNRKSKGKPPVEGFVTEYIHWRSKKVMKASDYGYKAWPLGPKKRKG